MIRAIVWGSLSGAFLCVGLFNLGILFVEVVMGLPRSASIWRVWMEFAGAGICFFVALYYAVRSALARVLGDVLGAIRDGIASTRVGR